MELSQARTGVGLGKHHVEAQNHDAVLVEQFRDQVRHLVPTPRPASQLRQTLFVDIENDNLVVFGIGRGEFQTRVIDDVV